MRLIIVISAWAAAIVLLLLLASDETLMSLTKEGGLIEGATVASYVLCLAYILGRGAYGELKWIFWLVVLLLLRELDFDSRFTDAKIYKLSFLLNGEVPIAQKLYAVGLLALSLFVVIKVITTYAVSFLDELKSRSNVAAGVVLIGLFTVVSKLTDGAMRKWRYFGLRLSEHGATEFEVFEEISELFIPILIAVTVSYYMPHKARPPQRVSS
jgi:hypothetical protein